jgi:transposase
LGLDETRFLAATARRSAVFVTGFVDLHRGQLLDLALGRSGTVVRRWLEQRGESWLTGIDVVALDPFRGYANGLLEHLGHARVVVDHFHAVRLANAAIDDARRRVQQETLGHRGRSGDPLYGIRRTLLRASERLGQRGWERLIWGLEDGDPDGHVAAAWLAKEHLRAVYAARTRGTARRRLDRFYAHCGRRSVPELTRLAKTVRAWETEILAYHATAHLSNGPTEAVNLLIEKIRRVGHGFRNFENYRLRLLLRCGVTWHTPLTARIRGRQPRLVA